MGKVDVRSLIVRSLSGVALFVVVLLSLLSVYSFIALMLVISVGSLLEFYRMVKTAGYKPMAKYGIITTVSIVLLNSLIAIELIPAQFIAVIALLLIIPFALQLYNKDGNPFVDVSISLMGIIYVALPISLMIWIAIGSLIEINLYCLGDVFLNFIASEGLLYDPVVVLFCIFIIWINDVGAYLVGVTIGRNKLFERISPKKSWEGFFGGVVASILFGVFAGFIMDEPMAKWGILGVIVAVTGVYGDLVESMFKRFVGVKDSGSIMPGHGGFLDRFDALLFAMPFIFVYLTIFASWN